MTEAFAPAVDYRPESILLAPEGLPPPDFAKIRRFTRWQCLVFALVFFSGLPASLIAGAWQALDMNTALALGTFTFKTIFLFFYIVGLGSVIPTMLMLVAVDLLCRLVSSATAVLELTPEGIRRIPGNWYGEKAFELAGIKTTLFPWQSVCAVTYGAPSRLLIEKYQLRPSSGIYSLTSYHPAALYLFARGDGLRPAPAFHIYSDNFACEQKRKMLECIRRWAGQTEILPEVDSILLGQPLTETEDNFTGLWLQLLDSSTERNRVDRLKPGDLLRGGAYRVVRRLETGGQANIYLAQADPELLPEDDPARSIILEQAKETNVVLKEFIPSACGGNSHQIRSLSAFEVEACLLPKLAHRNLIKFFDCFMDKGRAYSVLEYVDGTSLRKYVEARGRLPEDEVIEIAIQICEALKYLHGLEPPVVHRDLTPENLLLNVNGEIKLIDFSCAVRGENKGYSDDVVGKQAYISPEQFRGAFTKQSDIYSLGATMFFLLTGEDPVPITESHPADTLPGLSLPTDFRIARCTALDPNTRYKDVGKIRADLATILGVHRSRLADSGVFSYS